MEVSAFELSYSHFWMRAADNILYEAKYSEVHIHYTQALIYLHISLITCCPALIALIFIFSARS